MLPTLFTESEMLYLVNVSSPFPVPYLPTFLCLVSHQRTLYLLDSSMMNTFEEQHLLGFLSIFFPSEPTNPQHALRQPSKGLVSPHS